MSKPKVFISYSHLDEDPWKNRLQKHLEVLDRRGSLSFWEDRQIAAGAEWYEEIKAALESAEAAVLLISVDFLRSKFIRENEVPAILQRRMQEGMKVFPLILRSCPWQGESWLSGLQARPTDGKPLAQYETIGKLGGAINQRADAVLAELPAEQQLLALRAARGTELEPAEIEFITWIDRPDFQIKRIYDQVSDIVPFSENKIRQEWFSTLIHCGEREKALVFAREIEQAYFRAYALRSIAKALAQAGMNHEALATAREIKGADARAYALVSVANNWLDKGKNPEAEGLLNEICNVVNKIYSTEERSAAERDLAIILARLHRYREARLYADLCQHEDRLAAYTAIVREYHIERNPRLAPLFVHEAEETEDVDEFDEL